MEDVCSRVNRVDIRGSYGYCNLGGVARKRHLVRSIVNIDRNWVGLSYIKTVDRIGRCAIGQKVRKNIYNSISTSRGPQPVSKLTSAEAEFFPEQIVLNFAVAARVCSVDAVCTVVSSTLAVEERSTHSQRT